MPNTYGGQQSDRWLRNRVGRITGSRIADVCSYLTRKSGSKEAGDSSGKRDDYKMELIFERLSGRTKDHYNSAAMQRGSGLEDEARLYYESVMREMCAPVNFVLHPQYDFTGVSPDALVGTEGVLEIKCLLPWNHLKYAIAREAPDEYLPQVAWELACTGRKWVDFVLYCPDIVGCDSLRFFYRRMGRDELEWTVGAGWDERKLTGEAVIDYYTAEVLKLNGEIDAFMAKHGAKPIAPFPVEVIEEEEREDEDVDASDFSGSAYDFIDEGIVGTP